MGKYIRLRRADMAEVVLKIHPPSDGGFVGYVNVQFGEETGYDIHGVSWSGKKPESLKEHTQVKWTPKLHKELRRILNG